ncbi:hypothetical protein D3C85_1061220 [compost metagenome]
MIDGQVVRQGVAGVVRGIGGQRGDEAVIRDDDAHVVVGRNHGGLFRVGDQHAGLAVLHAQPDAIRAEQGEQRHGNRAHLHCAEHRHVKRQRGLQHHRHTVAGADALVHQIVREARGRLCNLPEAEGFITPRRPHQDDRGLVLACVPVDAFVRDVHAYPVAVEQLPKFVRGAERLSVCVGSGLRQRRHVVVPVWVGKRLDRLCASTFKLSMTSIDCIYTIQRQVRGHRPKRAQGMLAAIKIGEPDE